MTGLDTNVLVRYLTQDDPVQARRANAVVVAALEKGERCRLESVVLCEPLSAGSRLGPTNHRTRSWRFLLSVRRLDAEAGATLSSSSRDQIRPAVLPADEFLDLPLPDRGEADLADP